MSEVTFAKTFLQSLDSRAIKLQADYAIDPKELELKAPYTLPRMPQAMRRKTESSTTAAPGSTPSLTIQLKMMKGPAPNATLSNQSFTTSILDIKKGLAEQMELADGGVDTIRLLYKSKPCADSKTVKEVLGGEEAGLKEVEFKVMFVAGGPIYKEGKGAGAAAAAVSSEDVDTKMEDVQSGQQQQQQDPPVAQGDSGQSVMEAKEFWVDLKGFLDQRVRDQAVTEKAVEVFRKAWEESVKTAG